MTYQGRPKTQERWLECPYLTNLISVYAVSPVRPVTTSLVASLLLEAATVTEPHSYPVLALAPLAPLLHGGVLEVRLFHCPKTCIVKVRTELDGNESLLTCIVASICLLYTSPSPRDS